MGAAKQRTKNNHYVPRMLLRNFATDKDPERVHVFDVHKGQRRDDQSVGSVGNENSLYRPAIEDNLGLLEGELTPIISEAIQSDKLPHLYTRAHSRLMLFTVIQSARTRGKVNELNEMVEKTAKFLIKKDTSLGDDNPLKQFIDKYKITWDNPAEMNLRVSLDALPFMADMHTKLLINKTQIPFILSDDPVIRVNPYLDEKSPESGNCGFGCKGLMVFLPLGPWHMFMIYDPEIYTVGSRNLQKREHDCGDKNDILTLNILQCASTVRSFYFNDRLDQRCLDQLIRKSARYRIEEQVTVEECKLIGPMASKGELFRIHGDDLSIRQQLSFVKVPPHAQNAILPNCAVHLRDYARTERYSQRMLANAKGTTVEEYVADLVKTPIRE